MSRSYKLKTKPSTTGFQKILLKPGPRLHPFIPTIKRTTTSILFFRTPSSNRVPCLNLLPEILVQLHLMDFFFRSLFFFSRSLSECPCTHWICSLSFLPSCRLPSLHRRWDEKVLQTDIDFIQHLCFISTKFLSIVYTWLQYYFIQSPGNTPKKRS